MVVKKVPSNIQPLNAAGARQIEQQAKQEKRDRYIHNKRRWFFGVLSAIIAILMMVLFHQKYVLSATATKNLVTTQKQLQQAKAQQRDLKQQRRDLKDNSYLEKVVRDKYMYTKKGEIVFNLPKD